MTILFPSPRPSAVARPVALLRWRRSWCASMPLIWAAAMLSAPTVWGVSLMLRVDPRCDHPFFWWTLPLIVAVANIAAITHVRGRYSSGFCANRRTVGLAYFGVAVPLTLALVLFSGWISGFMLDTAPLMAQWLHRVPNHWWSTAGAAVCSALFALASHLLSAAAVPWLAFGQTPVNRK